MDTGIFYFLYLSLKITTNLKPFQVLQVLLLHNIMALNSNVYMPPLIDPFEMGDMTNSVVEIVTICDEGEPYMSLNVEFFVGFTGLIYVKDQYKVPQCRFQGKGHKDVIFKVPLFACGTKLFEGIFYNTVVIKMESDIPIIDMWDRSYLVTCDSLTFYQPEALKVHTWPATVPMHDTTIVPSKFQTIIPKCQMKIVAGSGVNHRAANQLFLGQRASLVLKMPQQEGNPLDIKVTSCSAEDSSKHFKMTLYDANRCSPRHSFIGPLQQEAINGSIFSYFRFNTFRFAEDQSVVFACNVEICEKKCKKRVNPCSRNNPAIAKRETEEKVIYNETITTILTIEDEKVPKRLAPNQTSAIRLQGQYLPLKNEMGLEEFNEPLYNHCANIQNFGAIIYLPIICVLNANIIYKLCVF